MDKKYHSGDRSVSIAVDEQGLITEIRLRGNSSINRVSSQLATLHKKALTESGITAPTLSRDEALLDTLKNPPNPAFAELFDPCTPAWKPCTVREKNCNSKSWLEKRQRGSAAFLRWPDPGS